jgi:hypothetical protein
MNCIQAEESIHAHLDGELEASEAVELGVHLGRCPDCSELMADLRQLNGLLARLPNHPAEGALARNALKTARLESAFQACPSNSRRWIAASLSAAAMTALIATLWMAQPPAINLQPQTAAPMPAPQPPVARVTKTPPAEIDDDRYLPKPSLPPDPALVNMFKGEELLNDLHLLAAKERIRKSMAMIPEQREIKKREAALLGDLRQPKKSGPAARELSNMTDPEGRLVWQIAAAVADPVLGAEIFESISDMQPELRLAPIYIAALTSPRLKQAARDLLCGISGKKYGASVALWTEWWVEARARELRIPATKS